MDAQGFAGRGKPQGSQGGGGDRPKTERKITPLRPVNIRMLKQAEQVGDGILTINKREVNQVVIAGQIVKHDNAVGGMNTGKVFGYQLFDGTDCILVKQWYDQTQQLAQIPVDTYIRFVGTVKVFKGDYQVTGQATPMTSLNEFLYHKMDVLSSHLRITKGAKDLPQPDAPAGSASPGAHLAHSPGAPVRTAPYGVAPLQQGTMPQHHQHQPAPMQQHHQQGASGTISGAVSDVLRQSGGAALALDQINDAIKHRGFSMTDIRKAVSQMMMEGSILEQHNGFSLPQ